MDKSRTFKSARAVKIFAADWAKRMLFTDKGQQAMVVGLVGNLGSGKTTFTQGFIRGCGVRRRVLSPTFVILKRFRLPLGRTFQNIYHLDAYRIHRQDLADLGWKDILAGRNLVIVEWADRIRPALPRRTIWVHFKHGKTANERHIIIN